MDKDQAEEYVRCRKDPIYFIKKYGKIRHPTKGLLPFALLSLVSEIQFSVPVLHFFFAVFHFPILVFI